MAVSKEIPLAGAEHVLGDLEHQLGAADFRLQVLECAADSDARRQVGLDDQVGSFHRDGRFEEHPPGLHALAWCGSAVIIDRFDQSLGWC